MASTGKIEIPFAPEQVANLMKSQSNPQRHPFTCPNRGDGKHVQILNDLGALIPTVRGWICPFCDYTQGWSHAFMAEAQEHSESTG